MLRFFNRKKESIPTQQINTSIHCKICEQGFIAFALTYANHNSFTGVEIYTVHDFGQEPILLEPSKTFEIKIPSNGYYLFPQVCCGNLVITYNNETFDFYKVYELQAKDKLIYKNQGNEYILLRLLFAKLSR